MEPRKDMESKLFAHLAEHVGCECEVALVDRKEPLVGKLVSFNKNPLTLHIRSSSFHIVNFRHVVEIRFAGKKDGAHH